MIVWINEIKENEVKIELYKRFVGCGFICTPKDNILQKENIETTTIEVIDNDNECELIETILVKPKDTNKKATIVIGRAGLPYESIEVYTWNPKREKWDIYFENLEISDSQC